MMKHKVCDNSAHVVTRLAVWLRESSRVSGIVTPFVRGCQVTNELLSDFYA
jgi:hypothetical protein